MGKSLFNILFKFNIHILFVKNDFSKREDTGLKTGSKILVAR